MRKANILIEALLSLSLVVMVSLFLVQLFPEIKEEINIVNPFNELSEDCQITCSLKKLIP